jgi:hypothetical protein
VKRCTKGGVLQPLENFYRASGGKDGVRGDCKSCFKRRAAERYRANPEPVKQRVKEWQQANAERLNAYRRARREDPAVKARERAGHLRRKHGLSPEQYEAMLVAQGGGCAICGRGPGLKFSLHVDHDHETGRVRGISVGRATTLSATSATAPTYCSALSTTSIRSRRRPRPPSGGGWLT